MAGVRTTLQDARGPWWRDREKRETIAVAVLCFILGYLLASRYGLSGYSLWMQWQQRAQMEPWRSAALRADLPLGTQVKLPALKRLDGKVVQLPLSKDYTGLVFMMDPEACQTNSVLRGISERQQQGLYPKLHVFIVVPTYRPERTRRMWQMWGSQFPVLLDEGAQLARQLNVAFENRAYLFAPDGRLLYRTSFRQEGEEIERDVARIVNR
ncbi:MAG: peroxiredoxin family protein [Armatimonadota bacterium]